MSKYKEYDTEMNLIRENEYYLFYEMMVQALKTDDVKEGFDKSLYLLRFFLDSSNIALFRKNTSDAYVYKVSDSSMHESIKAIGLFINENKNTIEKQEVFIAENGQLIGIDNVVFIYIKVEEIDCILVICNCSKCNNLECQFWKKTRETMQIILKRAISYEKNTLAITTDLLTGLNNRNSYEQRVSFFDNKQDGVVFAIFDLFRLKYINDNYSHSMGDNYIKGIANILDKYWPSEIIEINANGIENIIETGHRLYRIGGDEFVLFTTADDLNTVKKKAKQAALEAKNLKLDIDSNLPIGLNYGIVEHVPNNELKQTFINADNMMAEDKKKMYLELELDRRK